MNHSNLKLALVENNFPDFLISRKDFIDFLDQDFTVISYVPINEKLNKNDFYSYNINTYPLDRKNKGFSQSIKLIIYFFNHFRKEKFDIVHTYRLHPNILATIAAKLAGVNNIINHVTGLGIAFSSKKFKNRIFKFLNLFIYQFVFLLSDKVIFQNIDDLNLFKRKLFLVADKFRLVESSGVNIDKYNCNNVISVDLKKLREELKVEGKKVIICISRLIAEKGVEQLYNASRYFGDNIQFFWVGGMDVDNPSLINEMKDTTNFKFLGKRLDITNLLAISDVFILPTYYREGVPRAIIEAMAMNLPIITTDMPGCRRTVKEGLNGFLIQTKSSEEIVKAVKKILNKDLMKMGEESRKIVEKRFASQKVFSKIESIYKE